MLAACMRCSDVIEFNCDCHDAVEITWAGPGLCGLYLPLPLSDFRCCQLFHKALAFDGPLRKVM